VLFLIHPLLGWIGAGSAVILLAVALIGELGVRRSTAQWNRQAREAHAFLSQASRNTEAAYAMGMIPALAAQWRRYRNAALETQIASAERSADVTSIARFMRLFLQALMLAAGAWLVIERNITPGAMLAATIILGRALQPVEHAVGMWRHAIAAWQALGRVDKLLAEQIVKPTQVTLPRPSGRIQVEQASFFPPGAARPVLRPLNFALEPGQALAIVGPSAAGKSTLARLLMGVYAPSTGSVRLDGAEVHGWDRIDFGRHAGYLPQDVELFAGTVAQNIARYKQTDGDGIVRAAMAAGAHEMILQLPQGYETEIGDGAALLSAGQRQRIALARAVFGAPAMVVLDEPNSSLDSAGDTALANCLAGLKSARTTVVIVTHRAEILRHVDRILCLQDGAQIGFGPRADILPRLYRGAGVAADPGAARIG
jgi:PrtD family type I secretion system ABC transporter